MTKQTAVYVFLLILPFGLFAQETTPVKTSARPDLPGIFTLEFGFNQGAAAPDAFDITFWGSRTVNLYYQGEIRLWKSPFSLVPGIGLSLERFKFGDEKVLSYASGSLDQIVIDNPIESDFGNVKKSQLITNFIEVPLELRFTAKPADPTRSFKLGVGGRVGYLYDSFVKVKYRQDGETKKIKDKQLYNLNEFRYSVFGRIGFGNVSFFMYFNLNDMFQDGKGLYENSVPVNFSTYTAGISLASF